VIGPQKPYSTDLVSWANCKKSYRVSQDFLGNDKKTIEKIEDFPLLGHPSPSRTP